MIRIVLFCLGTLFLGLGILGVLLPGLPTTPFVLLAAACYVRSSRRLYAWLIGHRLFGRLVRDFQEKRTIPKTAKIASVTTMTVMVTISALFLLKPLWAKLLVIGLGAAGAVVVLLFPTARPQSDDEPGVLPPRAERASDSRRIP
jgi:hypothetical protein